MNIQLNSNRNVKSSMRRMHKKGTRIVTAKCVSIYCFVERLERFKFEFFYLLLRIQDGMLLTLYGNWV